MDPFRGYANAIDDELQDAVAVLDAFHVVRLGLKAMEETRRRVQQQQLGHRGHRDDPLYRIRNALRAGAEKLSPRQITRLEAGLQAGDPNYEVTIAWRCYQQLRSAFATKNVREGKKIALEVLGSFHTCPIPEIVRLGRTLRAWRRQFLAYFTTDRANNGGTEAINAGSRGDHRLEGRLQPSPTAQLARLPGASGLRCCLHPPMNDSHNEWISSRGPANTHLSPAAVAHLLRLLRNALGEAEFLDLVNRNVAKAVKMPRVPTRDVEGLDVEQARALLTVLGGHRMHALFATTLVLGLRRGEVLGLTWADVASTTTSFGSGNPCSGSTAPFNSSKPRPGYRPPHSPPRRA